MAEVRKKVVEDKYETSSIKKKNNLTSNLLSVGQKLII